MKRGISFEIPNEYGSFLGQVLKPIDMSIFNWRIGDGESYFVTDGQLRGDLFPEDLKIIVGSSIKKLLENNLYYVIFADLKAFPSGGNVSDFETYEDFLKSECQLVLIVIDCSFTAIYCKNIEKLILLYQNAIDCGFKNVEFITNENDGRTRLSVW